MKKSLLTARPEVMMATDVEDISQIYISFPKSSEPRRWSIIAERNSRDRSEWLSHHESLEEAEKEFKRLIEILNIETVS